MATARVESQAGRTTVNGREARISPAAIARELAPLAAASGLSALGIIALNQKSPRAGLKAARFFNLLLASLMTGNGAGAERFVHPALRALPPRAYLEAEQAITRRYP